MRIRSRINYYFNKYILESIKRKLMGTLLLVMMVPLLIFMLISTHISRGAVESSEISSNLSRMELSSSYIEEQINWYDEFLFSALVDEKLVPSITTVDNLSTLNKFNTQSYIKDKLFGLYNGSNDILSVSLVSYEDHLLYKVEKNDFYISNNLESPKKQDNKDAVFDVDLAKNSFSFTRNIYRFEDQKLVGEIEIQVMFSFMNHIAENLQSNEGEYVLILDSQGNPLYNPGHLSLKKFTREIGEQLTTSHGEKYIIKDKDYYFIQHMMNDQIHLLKVVPKEVMMIGAVYIGQSGVVILVISILLTILLSIIVSNQVAKPIVVLSKTMEHVEENNFSVNIVANRSDEIGLLYRKYKDMIERIKDLIEMDYKREMENRDAQFLALQAQINPHFLYNTLQVIGGMALKKNAKEIYDMTQRLALMFRYITNKRGDLVFIREEVSHLKNYLYIQKVRFGESISIQLFVDEAVNQGSIPLLSLQPIIENSFKHGFESKIERGTIKIDIQKVFDDIEIVIEDNGVGMSKHTLDEVNRKLALDVDTQNRSIGLKNVDARMKLYFGKEYGIELYSKESEYTKVILTIPFKNLME
ncbi:sensor histidine kinase [Metabacillus sp. FJAT-53654]|uniref:Histidine kinase n=1 Tax=Metabacillus rhizosphaerae TaxID=3117747 RepID=A0ABZ2MRS8_9BACI